MDKNFSMFLIPMFDLMIDSFRSSDCLRLVMLMFAADPSFISDRQQYEAGFDPLQVLFESLLIHL